MASTFSAFSLQKLDLLRAVAGDAQHYTLGGPLPDRRRHRPCGGMQLNGGASEIAQIETEEA